MDRTISLKIQITFFSLISESIELMLNISPFSEGVLVSVKIHSVRLCVRDFAQT